MSIFNSETRGVFAASYPDVPHILHHDLREHELLELGALARLAEWLPKGSLECNDGDQPVGVDAVPEQRLENIGETIRNIAEKGLWAGLRNVEQHPDYACLLEELLECIKPQIEAKTGKMIHLQSFIFITSPGGVTPYHFDPEYNILLQIRGTKTMTVFPAGDPRFASDEMHEIYHRGGRPELPWRDDMASGGTGFHLSPGQAVYVPFMAPHYVTAGAEVSVSISLTWKSEWSYAEADARGFNAMMRSLGIQPAAPRRWPHQNLPKSYAYRALRKLGAFR